MNAEKAALSARPARQVLCAGSALAACAAQFDPASWNGDAVRARSPRLGGGSGGLRGRLGRRDQGLIGIVTRHNKDLPYLSIR